MLLQMETVNMKYLKYLAAVALLCGVSAVSYQYGRDSYVDSKDYQAACVLNDICCFALENIDEFDELYYDYVDNLDCDPKLQITKDDLNKYNWIY